MDLKPLETVSAIAAAVKVAEPFLAKILGPPSEELGKVIAAPIKDLGERLARRRQERITQVAAGSAEQVRNSGAEPVQVPDYILVPLLEKASLVDDDGLQAMWSSLLAHAAHPDHSDTFSHLYPEMLAGLSPRQAKFLQVYFEHSHRVVTPTIQPLSPSELVMNSRMEEFMLIEIVGASSFKWNTNSEKSGTIDTLAALGIFRVEPEVDPEWYRSLIYKYNQSARGGRTPDLPKDVAITMRRYCQFTVVGAAFVMAYQPLDGARKTEA